MPLAGGLGDSVPQIIPCLFAQGVFYALFYDFSFRNLVPDLFTHYPHHGKTIELHDSGNGSAFRSG